METFMVLTIIVVGLGGFFLYWADKRRRERLMVKYGDADVVQRIMKRMIWQGMSKDQLIDSRGRPVDVGTKIYKTKTTEIFKYGQTGKNRFDARITVENGAVVGWEEK